VLKFSKRGVGRDLQQTHPVQEQPMSWIVAICPIADTCGTITQISAT
jgi:hypothetical protein